MWPCMWATSRCHIFSSVERTIRTTGLVTDGLTVLGCRMPMLLRLQTHQTTKVSQWDTIRQVIRITEFITQVLSRLNATATLTIKAVLPVSLAHGQCGLMNMWPAPQRGIQCNAMQCNAPLMSQLNNLATSSRHTQATFSFFFQGKSFCTDNPTGKFKIPGSISFRLARFWPEALKYWNSKLLSLDRPSSIRQQIYGGWMCRLQIKSTK